MTEWTALEFQKFIPFDLIKFLFCRKMHLYKTHDCMKNNIKYLKIIIIWWYLSFIITKLGARARGYKTFFMLNSVEHEILNAHKYKIIKKFGLYSAFVGLLTFMSRKNSMLS